MSHLQGPPAELRFTLSIRRAATGQVDTFDMVGHVQPPASALPLIAPPPTEPEETPHGHHSQHRGT